MAGEYSVTVEGLHEMLKKLPDKARVHAVTMRILKRCGLRIVREAQLAAPQGKSRALMRSLAVLSTDEGAETVTIGSRLHYALDVEEGTGIWGPSAMEIFPIYSEFLHWRGGNFGPGDHFARSVAGQPPQHFMRTGILRARGAMGEEVKDAAQGLFSAA